MFSLRANIKSKPQSFMILAAAKRWRNILALLHTAQHARCERIKGGRILQRFSTQKMSLLLSAAGKDHSSGKSNYTAAYHNLSCCPLFNNISMFFPQYCSIQWHMAPYAGAFGIHSSIQQRSGTSTTTTFSSMSFNGAFHGQQLNCVRVFLYVMRSTGGVETNNFTLHM